MSESEMSAVLAVLADGVVFDWDRAAQIVRTYKARRAYAASHSQGRALIWENDKPAPRPAFRFAGNECLELVIGEEVWNCFAPRVERPDWVADTYWPEDAGEYPLKGPWGWFGAARGAPVERMWRKVDPPVGRKCAYCDQAIETWQDGFVLPLLGGADDPPDLPYHRGCFQESLGLGRPMLTD